MLEGYRLNAILGASSLVLACIQLWQGKIHHAVSLGLFSLSFSWFAWKEYKTGRRVPVTKTLREAAEFLWGSAKYGLMIYGAVSLARDVGLLKPIKWPELNLTQQTNLGVTLGLVAGAAIFLPIFLPPLFRAAKKRWRIWRRRRQRRQRQI